MLNTAVSAGYSTGRKSLQDSTCFCKLSPTIVEIGPGYSVSLLRCMRCKVLIDSNQPCYHTMQDCSLSTVASRMHQKTISTVTTTVATVAILSEGLLAILVELRATLETTSLDHFVAEQARAWYHVLPTCCSVIVCRLRLAGNLRACHDMMPARLTTRTATQRALW